MRPLHPLAHAPNHQQDRLVAPGPQDGGRVKGDVCLSGDALQGPVVDEGLALDLPDIACRRLAVAVQDGGDLLVVLLMGSTQLLHSRMLTVCWSCARTSQRLAGCLDSLAVCSAYVLHKPTQVCCQGLHRACSSHVRGDKLPGSAKQMGHPHQN